MYLRRSTLHNHDVVLVLNCDSGLVIPKFHVHYEPLFTTTKDFDSSSLWQERVRFVWLAGHNLSRADRLSKCAALSTHPSTQEGGKRACLDPSATGCHSQLERDSGCHFQQDGDPDAHLSPQEGSSSDDNPSQPGGASQTDAHLNQ